LAHALVTTEVITVQQSEALASSIEYGAVLSFSGVVRNHSLGKPVSYLEYDAYVPLAQSELLRIAKEAEQRWNVTAVILHRFGRLEIGDVSVIVSVGSAHRAEAFEACRWCIDTLKQDVPIWKRETGPDGSFWIEGPDAVQAEER
jgi:molybdopterin synthase catalytic subunit